MDKELMSTEVMSLYADLNKMSGTVKEKWEEIGHRLGLSSETLCTIGKKYKSSARCFSPMLSAWLHRKGVDCKIPSTCNTVTMRALVRALESPEVGESRLAAEIVKMKGEKPYTKTKNSQTDTQSRKPAASKVTSMESRQMTSLPKPELEDYLRVYYLRGSQHQKDEWPPSFNVEYIDQILIQQNTLSRQKSKVKDNIGLITKGQIEKIKEQRFDLKSNMAFKGRVCIINGAPGVGKTRLTLKLRRDWADKQLLNDFHLVLYIPLREPIARLSENVDELLDYFGENCNEGDRDLIKKQHGEGVLFILDGWDELRPSCRGDSQFFPKLIKGNLLPGCSIIVTSRPGASLDIYYHANQVIEILGFGRNQVEEYIQAYFNKKDDASKLISDLQKYPNVASTCYVAINLAIVCHVYNALDNNLPKTLTEVYKWFIIHTVLRYLQKRKVAEEIDEELPLLESTKDFFESNDFDETVKNTFKDSESLKDTLQKLGKLALSGLEANDLCFSRDDLVDTCSLDSHDHQFDGFGLLKPVQISHTAGSKSYYHFLHLSIQEFIAAFHISQMEASEQWKRLRDYRRYNDMVKFFCGIDQFKSQPLRIFFRESKSIRLFHLDCVCEGLKNHCKEISEQCSISFTLGGITQYCSTLQPQQWEVLGYIMSNSGTQWHFKCNKQTLEEKNLTCFNRHLTNDRSLQHFSLEEVYFRPCAIMQLSKICQLQVALKKMDIINCNLSDEDRLTFSRAMEHHPSLESLCIQENTVTSCTSPTSCNLSSTRDQSVHPETTPLTSPFPLSLHCEFLSGLKETGEATTLPVDEGGDGSAKFWVSPTPQTEAGKHILKREDGREILDMFMYILTDGELQMVFKDLKREDTGVCLVQSSYSVGESVEKIHLNVQYPPKYKLPDTVEIKSGGSVIVEFEVESNPPVDKHTVHTLTSNENNMSGRFRIKDNSIYFSNVRKEEAGKYTISCKNANHAEGRASIGLSVKEIESDMSPRLSVTTAHSYSNQQIPHSGAMSTSLPDAHSNYNQTTPHGAMGILQATLSGAHSYSKQPTSPGAVSNSQATLPGAHSYYNQPTPPRGMGISQDTLHGNSKRSKKKNCKELCQWLEDEGIDEKDIKRLQGININERMFMKLTRTSSELNEITEATKDQLEELQSDLSKDLSDMATTEGMTLTKDSQPTLRQLTLLEIGEEKVKIMESVCPRWKTIGTLMDFDDLGSKISLIEVETSTLEDRLTRVLRLWLNGESRTYKPASWRTLILLLKDSGCSALAEKINMHII